MYTLQQHTTKSGKVSPQWNLIKESTGEVVTRFVSKVQANSWLQEFQSFINGKTNENNQTVDQKAPIQQPLESTDLGSDSGVIRSSEQPRTDAVSPSSDVPQTTGDSMVTEQDQGRSDTPSTLSLRRQKDQELNRQFKSFLRESTEHINRGIKRQHEIVERTAAIAYTAIGIAASVAGVNVGDLNLGAKGTIHEPHGLQLDQETIDVKFTTT